MIADSSVIIVFSRINKLDLLWPLFNTVEISEGVFTEVCVDGLRVHAPDALLIKSFIDKNKIVVKKLDKDVLKRVGELQKFYPALGEGESECLALALQTKQKTLLLDDKLARQVARLYGLKPKGILHVLALAFKKSLLSEEELKETFRLILASKFRLSAEVVMEFWDRIETLKTNKRR